MAICPSSSGQAPFRVHSARGKTASSASARTASSHNILFKTSAEGQSSAPGWHTWRKLKQLDCSPVARKRRSQPLTLTVNVLRESPPVYVVHDFLSESECAGMMIGRNAVGVVDLRTLECKVLNF